MFVSQPMAIQTSSLWMEESGIWPDFFLNIKKNVLLGVTCINSINDIELIAT